MPDAPRSSRHATSMKARERERAAEAAAEAVLREIPAHQRPYLESLVRGQGDTYHHERYFRDPSWLASNSIDIETARQVIWGLEKFREAEGERRLTLSSMAEAAAILQRFRPARGAGHG